MKNILQKGGVSVFLFLLPLALFAAPGQSKYGHKWYAVAPEESLVNVTPGRDAARTYQLKKEAAEAFEKMRAAAEADGVGLVVVSAFRTLKHQDTLYENAKKKYRSPRSAAKWVAPPQYSEHHTGWTLDVGDAAQPKADVNLSFEKTPAFDWLKRRGGEFGFEMSFPRNNPQNIGYEPWHWRYTGAPEAKDLFRSK